MSLNHSLAKVVFFHHKIRAPRVRKPTMPDCDEAKLFELAVRMQEFTDDLREAGIEYHCNVLLRASMAMEEFAEWIQAIGEGDLVEAADAWADRMYLLLGDAASMGLPAEALFNEVASSNLTKTPRVTNGFAKGVKGPNYRPPDIKRVLKEHQDRSSSEVELSIYRDEQNQDS